MSRQGILVLFCFMLTLMQAVAVVAPDPEISTYAKFGSRSLLFLFFPTLLSFIDPRSSVAGACKPLLGGARLLLSFGELGSPLHLSTWGGRFDNLKPRPGLGWNDWSLQATNSAGLITRGLHARSSQLQLKFSVPERELRLQPLTFYASEQS